MKPAESFIGQPIRSLQTMLRVISQTNPQQPNVIPDGIYGQDTVNAVSAFQRRNGLSVTGATDQETWDAIVLEYEPALILVGKAQPIEVDWDPNEVVTLGQRHPNVYLAQGMLAVLSQAHESISAPGLTGELDLPTSQSLISFQQLNDLPMTGELDRITWFTLARHYPLASRIVLAPNPRKNQE